MSFIFGGNTGMSYDEIQRKRKIAESLALGMGTPKDVGEGLTAIGKALAIRGLNKKADAAEKTGRDELSKVWESLVGGMGSRPNTGGAPAYTPPAPVDPNSPEGIASDAMAALGKGPAVPTKDVVAQYITTKAAELGIDPDVALKVAQSEGLNANPADGWQSNVVKNGQRERSYGPFQLYVDGGLGNQFMQSTGLDPADPSTWRAQVDFALGHAKNNGWGAWYGARNTGIGDREGIPGGQSGGSQPMQAGGGPDIATLAQIAGSPYADPGQKAVAQALLTQQMGAMDPNNQLDLEYKRAQIDALKNSAKKGDRTSGMKEYDRAVLDYIQRGQPVPTFTEWERGNKASGAANQTVTIGGEKSVPPDEGELMKSLGKKEGEVWSSYLEAGATSAGTIQDMQLLDEIITMAPQGPISGRLANAFPGVNSAADAFNSVVKRVAPTLRAPGSGSTSDVEYDGMVKSLPQLSARPEANVAIAAMMKAKAEINVKRAEIVRSVQNGDIAISDGRRALSELDKQSIMTPELKAILAGLGPVDGGGEDLSADERKYLGLE